MATTTNFGWTTPDDTDLVKDGASAIRTLGSAIDTSFLDLKGGTTGQNLRKNSNTDLDFTWAGDATNTVIDAEGDLLVGDSADTLQRLAIGTTGQVLTVDTTIDGKLKWATAATGAIKQIVSMTSASTTTVTSGSYTDTNLTLSITPTSASSKIIMFASMPELFINRNTTTDVSGSGYIRFMRGATSLITHSVGGYNVYNATSASKEIYTPIASFYVDSPATTSATTYKVQLQNSANWTIRDNLGAAAGSLFLMEI